MVKEDGHENHQNNKEESFSLADLDLHHLLLPSFVKDDNDVSKLSLFLNDKSFFFHSFFKSLLLEILVMGATF